jgi:hypothetical protein
MHRAFLGQLALSSLSGCVIYIEHPAEQALQGMAVPAATGAPVPNANIMV